VNKPTLVYHADWSVKVRNRWCVKATLGADGRYTAFEPTPVGDPTLLLKNLRTEAGVLGTMFAGFDFPIGVPAHFAERARISRFRDFLPKLGTGAWRNFYSVCDKPEQISIHRPFYPKAVYKGRQRNELFRGHDVFSLEPLLRHCERGGNGQKQACCLFWTLGGSQVGKAAILGWKDVLVPALKDDSIRLWPVDGKLESLFKPGCAVIAETYPAECYGWFPGDPLVSKTNINSRQRFGSRLLDWARGSEVAIAPELKDAIEDGFPIGRDDAFDAVVGLFGMLQICLGQRDSGEPDDKTIREIEGWILGRQWHLFNAKTDPELAAWLSWASESGEVPIFVRTIAEAASIADLANYALLRPVLLELKRQRPRTVPTETPIRR
jgi:hypothetical protein